MNAEKRINNLLIRHNTNNDLFSIYLFDGRVLKNDLTYNEAEIYCTKHKEYLSRKKVRLKDIKIKRLPDNTIYLSCVTSDNEFKEMISTYPTIESARKDFYSKINRSVI